MKSMADALADLGEPIQDRALVLNVLRGLNERFAFMAQLIPRQRPFPSFSDVRTDLRLAELNMPQHSTPSPSALVVSTPSKPPASAPAAGTPRPPPPNGGSSGNGRGRRRRGGRGQGGSSGGPTSNQQWPSIFNPWTGSIHMWPSYTPGGPRGTPARPGHPSPHHALMAVAPAPPRAPGS
jgi:uncharacterized membrane protein YgcG